MIDAVVMVDVKQQCLQRDDDFDLATVFSERTHYLHTATSTRKTTKSKMQHSSVSFSLLFSFTSLFFLTLAESLVSLILSHNTHKHTCTLSRQIHHFRATKTSCCGRGSTFSDALVSLCLEMPSWNRVKYYPCKVHEEISDGLIYRWGRLSQVQSRTHLTDYTMRLQVGDQKKREEERMGIETETKEGSSCPIKLTSWLPEIRERPHSSTVLSLSCLIK